MSDDRKYWPIDVLLVEERTPFHSKLIAFLERAYAAGYAPYLNALETEICLGAMETRHAMFVWRGNPYWEPYLSDYGKGVRLGPLFGLDESKCVVFDGIDDVAKFAMRWMGNQSVESAVRDVAVYDPMDAYTELKLRE
ncbi:MAG: hypothetical protein AAF394_05795 [Planctomycetota bacterium]